MILFSEDQSHLNQSKDRDRYVWSTGDSTVDMNISRQTGDHEARVCGSVGCVMGTFVPRHMMSSIQAVSAMHFLVGSEH